jgi:hypothetical protein
LQPLQEGREASLSFPIVGGPGLEHADATHPVGLLRVHGARPGDCRAAKKGDEFAPLHGPPQNTPYPIPKRSTLRPRRVRQYCAFLLLPCQFRVLMAVEDAITVEPGG